MKKLFAILVAITLVASFVYAGDDITPAAKAGATSLNFTFGGLGTFNLGGFGPSAQYPIDRTGDYSWSSRSNQSFTFYE